MKNLISILLISILVFSGCKNNLNQDKPPKIILGQDPCDNCFMLINEMKYAASMWLENGEAKRFDDIGCLLDYLDKTKDKILTIWVYDFGDNTPIKSQDAYYVKSDKILTPMSSGIVAFKNKNAALDEAKKYDTKENSFDELIKK